MIVLSAKQASSRIVAAAAQQISDRVARLWHEHGHANKRRKMFAPALK